MSTHPWHIAILIPARDEEELLPRCLRSIDRARRYLSATASAVTTGLTPNLIPNVTTDVIVVSDCSTDRTEAVAASHLQHPSQHPSHLAPSQLPGQHPSQHRGFVLSVAHACVGSARAEAAHAALARHPGPRHRIWLANTDADCEVPEDWLLQHLSIARSGTQAVAGIIDVDSFSEHAPHVHTLFRRTYLLPPDGTHPHIHGANLGVRADAYLRAGGWAALTSAEDHDLWHRLGLSGATRLSLASLRVLTSGRRQGRAPKGFADALSAHNGNAA